LVPWLSEVVCIAEPVFVFNLRNIWAILMIVPGSRSMYESVPVGGL